MSPAPQPADSADLVRVARIGKPHGIRGEVTVQVFTDDPEARFAPGESLELRAAPAGAPAALTVARSRWNKTVLVVAVESVPDRNAAEALRGAQLFAAPSAPADDDTWYEDDLLGLAVHVDGTRVGEVAGLTTGAVQDLLVVRLDGGGRDALVPFVEEIVPEVDQEAGVVVLTPPPGLLEIAADEPGAPEGPETPADLGPEALERPTGTGGGR